MLFLVHFGPPPNPTSPHRHVNRDLVGNNTFLSLDKRINCTGRECITACKTLDSTINHQTTLGSTINSTETCVVIVKNVNSEPHCEGKPKASVSVSLSRGLCRRAVACPRGGSQRGCSCCTKPYFKNTKCPGKCSNCATGSASYGKFLSVLLRGR